MAPITNYLKHLTKIPTTSIIIQTLTSSPSSPRQKQFQHQLSGSVTKNRILTQQPRRGNRQEALFSKPKVEIVHRKLKEMEKMMNDDIIRDVDVREFLHCYSRLRYAAYIDVVEHFFMEVYSDLFSSQPLQHTGAVVRSRYPTVVGVGSYGDQ